MLRDKHDVNSLIGTLEALYGPNVSSNKVEAIKKFIEGQQRTGKPSDYARQLKVRFDLKRLKEFSEMQMNQYPHLNFNLYDSPAEYDFAMQLHFDNLVWTPRHQVGKYRLDFAFIPQKVDVEIDGVLYHGLPHQQRRDEFRDKYLNNKGWSVVRISAYDAQYKGYEKIADIKILLDIRSRRVARNLVQKLGVK